MTGHTTPSEWCVTERDSASQTDIVFTVASPDGECYSALMDSEGQFAFAGMTGARPSMIVRCEVRQAVYRHLFALCKTDTWPS